MVRAGVSAYIDIHTVYFCMDRCMCVHVWAHVNACVSTVEARSGSSAKESTVMFFTQMPISVCVCEIAYE